jgi:tetratricopeptide (TPR) repeat protein
VVLYVFNINYQEYKSTKITKEIEILFNNNQEDKAMEKIKSISNLRYSNKGDLYMGPFNLLIQGQKPLKPANREIYHNLVADELIKIIQKRPYLTKSYVLAMIHLSSKVNFEDVAITDHDVTKAKYLYERSKHYNLNQPEMETYYSLILLSSKKESDIKDGVAILEHAIKYYPEKGIFNLMYGHYLLERSADKAEAVKQIKEGLEKPGAIETLSQLSRSLKALLNQKETDFVIKIATNYLPQNSHRMELFIILSEAYLQKNDYGKSFENYKTAQEMYDKVKAYHYSSTIEKELLDLQTRINKIK